MRSACYDAERVEEDPQVQKDGYTQDYEQAEEGAAELADHELREHLGVLRIARGQRDSVQYQERAIGV